MGIDDTKLLSDDVRLALGRLLVNGQRKDAEDVFKYVEILRVKLAKAEKTIETIEGLQARLLRAERVIRIASILNLSCEDFTHNKRTYHGNASCPHEQEWENAIKDYWKQNGNRSTSAPDTTVDGDTFGYKYEDEDEGEG